MSNADASSPAPPADATQAKTQTVERAEPKSKPQYLPPYNVVLLDDNDHTYEYVIQMIRRVFGYAEERGYKLAKEVDANGRVILLTTHREHAELKRDQVLAFGSDPRIAACRGSMSAIIEPAETPDS